MENLTPEELESTFKQIRQGKEVNQQNQHHEMEQPQQNARRMAEKRKELDVETKKR